MLFRSRELAEGADCSVGDAEAFGDESNDLALPEDFEGGEEEEEEEKEEEVDLARTVASTEREQDLDGARGSAKQAVEHRSPELLIRGVNF